MNDIQTLYEQYTGRSLREIDKEYFRLIEQVNNDPNSLGIIRTKRRHSEDRFFSHLLSYMKLRDGKSIGIMGITFDASHTEIRMIANRFKIDIHCVRHKTYVAISLRPFKMLRIVKNIKKWKYFVIKPNFS